MKTPGLRLIQGGDPSLPVRPVAYEILDRAMPLARQLAMMADLIGPASREVADDLIALLESPRRPRRVA